MKRYGKSIVYTVAFITFFMSFFVFYFANSLPPHFESDAHGENN